MRCYFCLEERNESEEHVFPLAIGGTLVTMRVCKPCNDVLGSKVDSFLTDHFVSKVKRSELGLAGNARRIPNPLVDMLAEAYLASDPEKRMDVRDDGRGGITVKHRYHESEQPDVNGDTVKTVTIDAGRPNDVIKIIDRHRKRAGTPLLTEIEKAKILADLPEAIRTIEQPQLRGNFAVDIVEYRRGLLKIAYELACMWLGDSYLNSPTAAELRRLVLGPIADILKSDLVVIQFGTTAHLRGWGETELDHVAYGFVEKGTTIVSVRVFDSFSAAIIVALPGDPSVPKSWRGRFLSINPASGSIHESDWPEAIAARLKKYRSPPGQSTAMSRTRKPRHRLSRRKVP